MTRIDRESQIITHEVVEFRTDYANFTISGFSGNCSILILADVEPMFSLYLKGKSIGRIDQVLTFAEDVCRFFDYASLMFSGTSPAVEKYLVEKKGYVTIHSNTNFHSGNATYLVVKNIEERKEPR